MKILLLALSRSGHHAVLNWLIKQLKGSTIHYNNCELGWENGDLKPARDRVVSYISGKIISDPNGAQGLTSSSPPEDFDNQAYSIESFDMKDYQKFNFDNFDFDRVILVVRNFYNWVASSTVSNAKEINSNWKDYRGRDRIATKTLWLDQAKELCGETNIIASPKTLISYDDWFNSEEYRLNICNEMQLGYSNEGLDEIPDFGGGSGFTNFQYNGNAQKMDVLNRWKNVPIDSFKSFYSDEIDELNKKIFNLSIKDLL